MTVFLHKGAAGEWDFDTLANEFELDDLLEWGFEKFEIGIIDPLPNLDELRETHGEPSERDFWPVIKIKVSPETERKYKDIPQLLPGIDEAEKFDALVSSYGV